MNKKVLSLIFASVVGLNLTNTLNVDASDKDYEIIEYNNGGIEDIEESSNLSIQPQSLFCYDHTNSDRNVQYDSGNSNASVTNYAQTVWDASFTTCKVSTSGNTVGYWGGNNSAKMVFNQTYSVNGGSLSVTGGWGAGYATYNTSKSEGSWQSEPIYSTYRHTVSKPNMTFSSNIAIYSVTFTDTVDIYVPGATYRPTASVYLN